MNWLAAAGLGSWLAVVRLISWFPWSIDQQLRLDSGLGDGGVPGPGRAIRGPAADYAGELAGRAHQRVAVPGCRTRPSALKGGLGAPRA